MDFVRKVEVGVGEDKGGGAVETFNRLPFSNVAVDTEGGW